MMVKNQMKNKMMNLIYKASTKSDIHKIFEFSKNLIDEYEDIQNIDYEKVLKWVYKKIEENIHEYTSIYLDNTLVGYYHFHEDKDKMELDDFYIFSEYQNKGIGSKVLSVLIQTENTIYLYVFVKNVKAIKLYERFGFKIVEYVNKTRYIMER